jgi:hypothetical protein
MCFPRSSTGLLGADRYANLEFCAEDRAERECVRALSEGSGQFSGVAGAVSAQGAGRSKGWRSSAGRASDL